MHNKTFAFSRYVWLTAGLFVLLVIVFAGYAWSEKQIDRANDLRYQSYLLADELRQSSDDLTSMAESYVVTGDPVYKANYQAILDIRDGKIPRPVGYQTIYRDLALKGQMPNAGSGSAISLLELMRQAGFSGEEFSKLAEAKARSDGLTATEFEAMRLAETTGSQAEASRAKALLLIHDDRFHQGKAAIMKSIDDFYQLMNKRMLNALQAAKDQAMLLRGVFVVFGLALMLMFWRINKCLYVILGGSLNEVHAHIAQIGSGDFSSAIPVADGKENSVLGWLAKTKANLNKIDDDRKGLESMIMESRKLLLTIIDSVPIGIYWKDRNLRYFGCNSVFARDAGVAHPKDVIGKDDYQMGWAEQATFYSADDRAVMESGIAKLFYDSPHTTLDGRPIWLRLSKLPLRNMDNEVFGLLGVYEDITERKQAEKKVHQLSMAVEQSPVTILITDITGAIEYVNPKFTELTGYTFAEVLGQNPRILESGEHTLASYTELWDTILSGEVWRGELHSKKKNGELFWEQASISPIKEIQGEVTGFVTVKEDITERKQAEQALLRQLELVRQAEETLRIANEEQRAIFDSVTSGIALIKDSVIVRCNRKLEDIFGYAQGELNGKSARLWYPDDVAYQIDGSFVYNELAKGEVHCFERQLVRKDGSFFWARLSGQAMVSNDPALAIVEIIDNITTEREAVEVLLKGKAMAEDAARIKAEFLANMSHEIRTPINGVLGMLDLLRETDMTPVQLDWLDMAHSSGEALLGIINDILDLSKLEAGKVDVEQIDFNLVDLVDDICAVLAGQAHAKGLELNCSLPVVLPLRWQGDPLRIRQVLTNLIGNAVKFTAQGEVSVSVTPSMLADSQNELRFEVRDTGIGISAAVQTQLFKSFSQADSSISRSFGGSGLGLFICKKLVELMGGAIGMDSVLGKGACFWFTLPLVPSAGVETVAPSYETYDPSGKRVLIVDDNETSRNILCTYLTRWGMAVDEADNGNAALIQLQPSALRGVSYDLIVLDREMPEMDGLTLAKCLAQIPALAKIPIILLSSYDHIRLADYQHTGIVRCLMKPVRQLQLFEAIVNALQGVSQATQTSAWTEVERPSYKGKKVLVVEDNKINQKVIVAKLAKYDIFPDLAENGQLALDKLAQSTYDLIFMDCQMPVLDGYAATRELRLLEAGKGLPHQTVIALTANALEGEREKCLAAGMDDYLSKPIVTEQLTAMLSFRLGNQPAEIAPPLSVAPASTDRNVWDATAVLDSLDGDSALLDEMIALFLIEGPKQLGELSRVQAEGNLSALANAAQTIKGTVAQFYAESAKDYALLLEQTARSGQSADYQGMTDALINAVTDLINDLRLAKNSTNSGKEM